MTTELIIQTILAIILIISLYYFGIIGLIKKEYSMVSEGNDTITNIQGPKSKILNLFFIFLATIILIIISGLYKLFEDYSYTAFIIACILFLCLVFYLRYKKDETPTTLNKKLSLLIL